jgi:hypothetical protein
MTASIRFYVVISSDLDSLQAWMHVHNTHQTATSDVVRESALPCPPRNTSSNMAVSPKNPQSFIEHHPWSIRCKNSCTSEMTSAPPPTADATRLIEPDLTSPTAKTPIGLQAWRPDTSQACVPVLINPLASRSIVPTSHSIFGSAPIMMKRFAVSCTMRSPVKLL